MQGLPVALLRPGSGAAPGLALPSLAGASGEDMDASSLAVLPRLSLAAQEEEEKAAKASEAKTDSISPGGGVRGLQGFSPGQASTAFPSAERSSERIMEQNVDIPCGGLQGCQGFSQGQGSTSFPPERISERIMEQNVDILGGGGVQGFLTRQNSAALSEQVPVSAVHAAIAPVVEFMASAPAVHAAPAPVGEFMASATSVHAAPAPVGEFMASAPSVHAAPGSSGDDASRVEQDIDVEGVDYLGRVVYHSGTCVMLDMVDFKWRSLGEGTYRLLRSSEGAKNFHFQFWRRRQLLIDDYISGLVSWWQQRSVLAVARP